MFPSGQRKLKRVVAKQIHLTNAQIFGQRGIERVKKDKRFIRLCNEMSRNIFGKPFFVNKYLKCQTCAKKLMKIDKVISLMNFGRYAIDAMDLKKDGFYSMQMCLCLKEGSKETAV